MDMAEQLNSVRIHNEWAVDGKVMKVIIEKQ